MLFHLKKIILNLKLSKIYTELVSYQFSPHHLVELNFIHVAIGRRRKSSFQSAPDDYHVHQTFYQTMEKQNVCVCAYL